MAGGPEFKTGDRVWLLNANGEPMMTGDTHRTRREITFKIKAVRGDHFELDTHDRDGRRYCGSIGVTADALMVAEQ